MPKVTKPGRIVTYLDEVLPKSHIVFYPLVLQNHVTNQNHYLQDHSFYGHQTQQNGGLPWPAPTNKITWPFSHMVLQDHMTN